MKTLKFEETSTGYTLTLGGYNQVEEKILAEDLRKSGVRVSYPAVSIKTCLELSPIGKTDVLQVIKDMGATPL